jgi:hypothetical protein
VPTNERWVNAFEISALIGFVQIVVFSFQSKVVNRLVLGGNIYLMVGGVCALLHLWGVFKLYNALQESAIIICMLIVGIFTTFFTSSGFIAVEGKSKSETRLYSYYLFLGTLIVLLCSVVFQGKILYSMVIPIAGLLFLYRFLVSKLEKAKAT